MKWYHYMLGALTGGLSGLSSVQQMSDLQSRMNPSGDAPSSSPSPSLDDSDYMSMIEKYRGTDYYELLKNNPYLFGNNSPYSPTLWQSIGEAFGDTSARDAYYQNLRSKSNEYVSQVLTNKQQNEFNAPSAQADRMRQAGQNPDLLGTGGVSAAADNDTDLGPVDMTPQQQAVNSIQQIGQGLMSAFSFAISFMQGVQGLRAGSLENSARELGVLDSMNSLANTFIDENMPLNFADGEAPVFDSNMRISAERYARDMFKSRSRAKQFVANVERNYSSLRGYARRYAGTQDFADKRFSAGRSLGRNDAYGSSGDSFGLAAFREVSQVLAKAELDILKMSNKADLAEETNRATYQEQLDPTVAAEAQNTGNTAAVSENQARAGMGKIRKVVNDTAYRVIDILGEKSKEKGISGAVSSAALLAVFGMMNDIMPSLPGVSFSKTAGKNGSKFNFSIH